MDEQAWLKELTCSRAIAVIRAPSLDIGYRMAQAVAAGGMRMLEVTWTSDRPGDLIQRLREDLPTCCVGAGTVLHPTAFSQAIAAGAQFLFSPHTDLDLLRWAIAHQVPMVPGALSPNEIMAAWQAGATTVKVFPVQAMGGAAYIRSLQGPLGHIPLIPTGGVTLQHAAELLTAGAIAVGVSGQLFPAEAI
ncbi:MAG TPA: bifunctional 4-hydroxy-2-oxoglutarate aldolase/2-dehydro-3-deoxy-phosphogluconate aldolase, partial [Candidatus Obscuribacterales bacterium]